MNITITVTQNEWKASEEGGYEYSTFVREKLTEKPIVQLYKNFDAEGIAYTLSIPTFLQVTEVPNAETGFFIKIRNFDQINGHIIIK